jgi:hypothetical protein
MATQLMEYWESELPGNGECQSSHNCVATWFPRVSSSITRFRKKSITEGCCRTADTRKSRGNATVRRLACSVAWKLIFSASLRVAWLSPQFALLHSVTRVQLWLIRIIGYSGCLAIASFLRVPSPLPSLLVPTHPPAVLDCQTYFSSEKIFFFIFSFSFFPDCVPTRNYFSWEAALLLWCM